MTEPTPTKRKGRPTNKTLDKVLEAEKQTQDLQPVAKLSSKLSQHLYDDIVSQIPATLRNAVNLSLAYNTAQAMYKQNMLMSRSIESLEKQEIVLLTTLNNMILRNINHLGINPRFATNGRKDLDSLQRAQAVVDEMNLGEDLV
jgi:uncharacterized protein YecA (UPF0149 family)